MLQKELLLFIGLIGILFINFMLPETAFVSKDLIYDYEILSSKSQKQNNSLLNSHKVNENNRHRKDKSTNNSKTGFETSSAALDRVVATPNSGTQGSSFQVNITANTTRFILISSGFYTITFSDGISSFTMSGSTFGSTTFPIIGTLSIPADANPSANYDVSVNNIGHVFPCIDCFTVLDGCTYTCPSSINDYYSSACNFSMPDYSSLINLGSGCQAPVVITQDPAPGVLISGDTVITFTVADAYPTPSECMVPLILSDTTSPTAVCQNITVYLDGSGNASITAADIDGGSSDNCGSTNLSASSTSFTCAELGANNVSLMVDDGNGNMSSCIAVVMVSDTTTPMAVCQNITVFLDGSGNASITAADIDGGSSDNCGTTNLSASVTAFTCGDLGPNNVTLTIDDGNGNISSCVAVVTVTDTISPTAVCQNITVYLDGSGNATITAADIDGGSSDNCGTANLSASTTSFTCSELGANNVSLMVDDGNGNMSSCVAVVTVSDTTSPTAVCQDITVYLDGSGNASITAADIDGGSSDNCGTANLSASTTSFTCANLGGNNVSLMVDDGNGNISSCVAVVTVSDTTSPTAVCQNITIYLDGSGNTTITAADIDGGSSDNCGTTNLSASTTSFTCSELGANNVSLMVDDGNGNISSCAAVVTVSDTTSPTAVCQNITIYLDGSGNATITAADIDGGSSDNCGTTNLSASTTSFTCSELGANNVSLMVDDGNGNMSSCVAVVTVSDTTSPTAVCQDITVYLDGSGSASLTAADIDGGSSDNCGTANLSASITSFTCAELGANNVTLAVDDGNGNMSNCIAIVTVSDTTSPTAVCQNITVFLDGSGNATITAADIDGGSSDNCGTANLSLLSTTFTCSDLGANDVTLIVGDGNGNISSCEAVATVSDTTSPTAVCQDITISLNQNGEVMLMASALDNGSLDNCEAVQFSILPTLFTCADVGQVQFVN